MERILNKRKVRGVAKYVIVRECGQTLGLGLVDKIRTVVYY